MAASFEQFNGVTNDKEDGDTPEENFERISSDEAFKLAKQRIVSMLDDVNEQLDDESSVRLKEREWSLTELPEEYLGVAVMQKKLQIIERKLDNALVENDESNPGTKEEAVSYFTVQMLARINNLQQLETDVAAKKIGLELQHPDLARAHNGMKVAA